MTPDDQPERTISESKTFIGLGLPEHPDKRLNRRQVSIQMAFAGAAGSQATIPDALVSSAKSEGFYRFVRNNRVDVSEILRPHADAVFAEEIAGTTLVIHDTTSIHQATAENAEDVYTIGPNLKGYLTHVALVVDEVDCMPIGVAHAEVVERTGDEGYEAGRWLRAVSSVAKRTRSREGVVHVCDREGDSYPLMAHIRNQGEDFVIRQSQDRNIQQVGTDDSAMVMSKAFANADPWGSIQVHTPSRIRNNPRPKEKKRTDRTERDAVLQIRVIELNIQRPKRTKTELPRELKVWVVRALETSPPTEEDPIDWWILTSLPVRDMTDAARVMRIYKARWLIEELFKALKTGLAFGETRFESRATSSRALALMLPIAAGLLRLRAFARLRPDSPATVILDNSQVDFLASVDRRLPASPTAADVMKSIARLGGFLKQNKVAGWLVLGRGYVRFITACAGWKLAKGIPLSAIEEAVIEM